MRVDTVFVIVVTFTLLRGSFSVRLPSLNITDHARATSCRCGYANGGRLKIIGGSEVSPPHKYPWQAYIFIRETPTSNDGELCGGTVLNKRYILTAMHCLDSNPTTSQFVVLLGLHDRSAPDSYTKQYGVEKVIKHSAYNTQTKDHDIAILKLSKDIDFSSSEAIGAACLPSSGQDFSGKTATVSGWGHNKKDGTGGKTTQTKLQEVTVKIMDHNTCRSSGYGSRITTNMMCAGYMEGGKDSCKGDSGGPLTVDTGGTYTVVGVVSHGRGCAEPNYPGVYAKVANYVGWIESNIADGEC